MNQIIRFFWIQLFTAILFIAPVFAGGIVIRDAEIETDIKKIVMPLWKAAGFKEKGLNIVIVDDDEVNAYVDGSATITINCGLLLTIKTPEQLLGVVAHEISHAKNGHIVSGVLEQQKVGTQQILSSVLGIATILSTGNADAGMAIISGSQALTTRNYAAFSRMQESTADQSAVSLMDHIHITSRGLTESLAMLDSQGIMRDAIAPYKRTHPMGYERVQTLKNRVESSKYVNNNLPPEDKQIFARIQGKLIGFLGLPQSILAEKPSGDVKMQYARIIALYRDHKLKESLSEMDKLLLQYPGDPYFLELKAQFLLESGQPAAALPLYQSAINKLPNEGLIRAGLANALMAMNDTEHTRQAIDQLKKITKQNYGSIIWKQLSVAYGRLHDSANASLASAEMSLMLGDLHIAEIQANKTKKLSPPGSATAIRANDIIAEVKYLEIQMQKYR